jgi:peptidoglycan/LPS O-acetylase OafA/YrhL
MKTENEILNLTGIRAFAAFWVVIYHWRLVDGLDGVSFLHNNAIIGRGYAAVDLFFVLSGFIIATVYHRKMSASPTWPTYKKYILLRWARLYPIHLVLFLGYAALLALSSLMGDPMGGEKEYTLQQALAHLTLTQAWHLTDGLSWNWPSWSISAEFFAYALLFPLYCLLFHRISWRAAVAILAVTWIAAFAYGQWSGLGFKTYDSGLLRITAEFMAGYLLFFASRNITLNARQANMLFLGSLGLLISLCYLPYSAEVLLLPALCGLIFSLYYGSSQLNRVFGNRTVVYLGHTSYALYMVHDLINLVTGQALSKLGISTPLPQMQGILLMVALIAISLVAASFCFHLIENPARNWMKRRLENPDAFSLRKWWKMREGAISQGLRTIPWYAAPAATACVYSCYCHQMASCAHYLTPAIL